jgi:cytochrome c oxidase assembly protein subunit 15
VTHQFARLGRVLADAGVTALLWLGRLLAPLGRALRPAWLAVLRVLRLRPDVLTKPSARGLRRLAATSVIANIAIIVSGGVVRVTESGLGCATWPRCTPDSLLPRPTAGHETSHMFIEFGNRTITFILLAIAFLLFTATAAVRRRRPDLVRLAAVQPFGVVGQAVLGGVTVLTDLNPLAVGCHFLLSALVLLAAVVLHQRASEGDEAPRRRLAPAPYRIAQALPYVGFLVLVAGTVVTGAGPHAGDADAPRYYFSGASTIENITRIHSGLVWLSVVMAVVLYVLAARQHAELVLARLRLLGVVIVLQGIIGYVQYALGVPGWLVLLHMLGSALYWIAIIRVRLAARSRGVLLATAELPARGSLEPAR